MGISRHFHVVFDVRVLDLKLSKHEFEKGARVQHVWGWKVVVCISILAIAQFILFYERT